MPRLSRRTFLHSALVPMTLAAQSRPGRKFFVLWDMEGTSGVFTREQAWYWEDGVRPRVAAEARELFTAEANALTAAALAAGASQLIVCDTHHGGGNFVREKLLQDPRVTYQYHSRGTENGRLRWMPGLDETVTGLMLPGHHAKAFTERAFMPHTNSFGWADFTINGLSVGEMGIEACFAGHWDIPVIFAQGDEAACNEAQKQFPGVVTANVKHSTAPELAAGLDPEAGRRETAKRAAEAVAKSKTGQFRPFKTNLPMTVTVRFRTIDEAARIAARPGVLRLDDHTVEARVGRQCDVEKWITGTGLDM